MINHEEQVKERESDNAHLDENLKAVVYGQDHAIEDIVDKILVAQAGLKSENKPIGSFGLWVQQVLVKLNYQTTC